MDNLGTSYTRSPSTTWDWRKVKIRRAPAGEGQASAGCPPTPYLRRRDRNVPIWVQVHYRGGAESSWVIHYRGRTWRFPGHWCLEDVMAKVNGE